MGGPPSPRGKNFFFGGGGAPPLPPGNPIPGRASRIPRLYGTFARVLGHYARDLGVLSCRTRSTV